MALIRRDCRHRNQDADNQAGKKNTGGFRKCIHIDSPVYGVVDFSITLLFPHMSGRRAGVLLSQMTK